MDSRFLAHNSHLQGAGTFEKTDPQLVSLSRQAYVYEPALLEQLPINNPGIYTLSGARQIGKTTLLKQWMNKLLKSGVVANQIAFMTGELIENHHSLLLILQSTIEQMNAGQLGYIIIDEVTYIKDWDKTIKYAADAGMLSNIEVILSGSDMVLLQAARMRFPGRRGDADTQDFHLYSLSFREFLELKKIAIAENNVSNLMTAFSEYLLHGGYLTAINDYAKYQHIKNATLLTYSDWIRGDMLKRGKQERNLKEILAAIIKCYGKQVTWHSLADFLSLEHPSTVADYIEILSSMDAVFIQYALLENKLSAAPKKARKVMFTDPFIYHAVNAWIEPAENAYSEQIIINTQDPIISSALVEATVATHFRRFFSTYYIKAENEIDIAYVDKQRFWPIEIKWTKQLRPKEFKQLLKYPNAKIWAKQLTKSQYEHLPVLPLPLALAELK